MNNDLISRADAIEALNTIEVRGPHDFRVNRSGFSRPFDAAEQVLLSMPAASGTPFDATELEYWQKDSAAAWDKCEENRLLAVKARAELQTVATELTAERAKVARLVDASENLRAAIAACELKP